MSVLEKILQEHCTFMVSKNDCGFCEASEKLFREHGVEPYIVKFEERPRDEMTEVLRELRTKKKHTTFPAIFLEGEFIGGYEELKKFYKKKSIKSL